MSDTNGKVKDVPFDLNGFDLMLANSTRTMFREVVSNFTSMRTEFFKRSLEIEPRDIDLDCGYPKELTIDHYTAMYDRVGAAQRVVNIFPDWSWRIKPDIKENSFAEETEFEREWIKLERKFNIYHFLHRLDRLSGIGEFGVMLLGIDDKNAGQNQDLSKAVSGFNDRLEPTAGRPVEQRKLLYLRVFDRSQVKINKVDNDPSSPRYKMPLIYEITVASSTSPDDPAGSDLTAHTIKVHWSRVIHVADDKKSSEVFGEPRMKPVYNSLYNIRKILGADGEGFYQSGFPGLSIESHPNLEFPEEPDDEKMDKIRKALFDYMHRFRRFLVLTNMTAKSLAPQITDPTPHLMANYMDISVTKGIPMRMLTGSEEGKMASTQDVRSLNGTVKERSDDHVTPVILRQFIDRLMLFRILPQVEDYFPTWSDLNALSEQDRALVAVKQTEAMFNYITGGIDAIVPPLEFFTMFMGLSVEEARTIADAMGRDDELSKKLKASIDKYRDMLITRAGQAKLQGAGRSNGRNPDTGSRDT